MHTSDTFHGGQHISRWGVGGTLYLWFLIIVIIYVITNLQFGKVCRWFRGHSKVPRRGVTCEYTSACDLSHVHATFHMYMRPFTYELAVSW